MTIVLQVIPLAVSGPTLIGAVVFGAVLLAFVLLRMESRDEAEEQAERREEQ